MRTCINCGEEKHLAEFRSPPHQNQCKSCYNEYMRAWRAARAERTDVPECSVAGCSNTAEALSVCRMHYNRLRREGDVGEFGSRIGSGDDVRYQAIHRRLMKIRGQAAIYTCACGEQAAHWAFVERMDDPYLKIDGSLRYSTDLSTYEPMCYRCHRVQDGASYRGERNGMATLTEDQVRAIREEHAQGGATYGQLGAKYGVTASAIGVIVRREAWTHI